ncbi:CsbD family protein [Pontibacter sp. JH31]|uniref:CsbD family protein n=2 Tax=Pontibacter aquaedesilientis TaxID=2766980 RepID=A0ABR7XET6_9BACT|nr:CsbD family protein [Pontibacter aquaedesilientis]
MLNNMNDEKGKILLATLAGIGAGVAAGMLLAPNNGLDTRDSLKRTLTKVGDDLERTVKGFMDKLENRNVTDDGSSLIMRGSWDDVKGQLKKNYAELTEDDLTYMEGQEDELFGRLQQKLGKTKHEIMKLIKDL